MHALLGALLLWTAIGPAARAEAPDDPRVVEATIRQEHLPAWQARTAAATARIEAWEAVRAGEAPLETAWTTEADLGDVAVLKGISAALDARAIEREREREPALEVPERVADELAAAIARALRAESEADAHQRAAALALRRALEDHPRLTSRAIHEASAPVRRALARVRASEDDPDAPMEALRLSESAGRWQGLARAVRLGIANLGERPIDVGVEVDTLARGVDDAVSADAAARLEHFLPILPEPARAIASTALITWIDETARPAREVESPPPAGATPDTLREALEQARAALEQAPAGDDPLATAIRALRKADLDRATAWHAAATRRADSGVTASSAAQDARREAARAAETADAPHPATRMRAESRAWTASAWTLVESFEDELSAAREARVARLKPTESAIREVFNDPTTARADAAYAALRREVDALRAAVLAGRRDTRALLAELPPLAPRSERAAQIQAWRDEAASIEDAEAREVVLALVQDAEEALGAEEAPRTKAAELANEAFGDALIALRQAKAQKHRLSRYISRDQQRVERGDLLVDAATELSLLQPQMAALLRERGRQLLGLPPLLLDFNRLTRTLWGLWWALILLGGATWLFRNGTWMARRALDLAERITGPIEREVRQQLLPLVASALRPLIVLVGAWLVRDEASAIAPELGVLASAFVVAAVMRLIQTLADLAVTIPDEPRPALVVFEKPVHDLMEQTLHLAAFWYVISWTLHAVLSRVFYADVLARALNHPVRWVGVAIAIWLLAKWEPILVQRMSRFPKLPPWLSRWMAQPPNRWLAPARALVAGTWLSLAAAWDLAQGRLSERSSYGSLITAMDRARLQSGDEEPGGEPLDAERTRRLLDADTPFHVAREKDDEALQAAVERWKTERRRGTLVLTGDRGDGKSTFLASHVDSLSLEGRAPRTRPVTEHLRTKPDALRWLAELLELPEAPDSADALVAVALDQPSRVFVIDHAHRFFLRAVGAFDALRTLLYVCNATGEHHLWVLVMHRPAWAFLTRIGSLVSVGTVRATIDLTPFDGTQLRELLLARTESTGVEPNFRRLVRAGPFGSSPEIETERSIKAYFRLLSEESGGCPRAALGLWVRSLRVAEDGVVEVILPPVLAADVLANLQREELFVLAALRTLDRLPVAELAEVVHLPLDVARAVVRSLEQRGLLHLAENGIALDLGQARAVSRVLRRRHILQWAM